MKRIFLFLLILLIIGFVDAQSVKHKDKYGSSIVYVDG